LGKNYFKKISLPDELKPITENHKRYHELCADPDKRVVLCTGYAGSGKSIIASFYGVKYLNDYDCNEIVVMRSLEGLGKDPGAYPGDAFEKNEPKLKQIMKYVEKFSRCDIYQMIRAEKFSIQSLYDVQGTDLTGKVLIVTEAQTLTAEEMYSVLTRGAEKVIIEGDVCAAQSVNHKIKVGYDGLSFLIDTIGDLPFVGVVEMNEEKDIVRNDYMRMIIMRMMPAIEERRQEEIERKRNKGRV
jgi:phosphate starvation-inducible PhoH-like protein